jgi:putative toxin-antitoxin system antitoxin component (TIGR02293 family)
MALGENRKAGQVLAKYEKSFASAIALQYDAKRGLKPDAVFDFIALSQYSAQVIEQLLKKTFKTLTAYKAQNTPLDSTISEKLLKLFALYDKGIHVFGSVESFNQWMAEPAFGLGNQVPQTFIDTITGIDLVGEELSRIEYGDLA